MSESIDINQTFGQPDEEPSALLAPETILANRYRLLKQIGRGGMGVVWAAEEIKAERKVVLKFVPSELKNFESAVAQLKESFKKIHELSHQHICPVYTLEEEPLLGYYHVMKWLDGETLDQYIVRTVGRRQPLPMNDVPRILRPVAEALDYAHGNRIVHRDIKPSNIFIVLDDEQKIRDVQVIDFGLASEIRSSMTRVSQVRFDTSGTRPYMAPEQWRGRPQSGATDQYALAVTAYELLAGYLPFDADDLEMLRMAVLQDTPAPIREMSDHGNAALLKALAKDGDERFASCVEFVQALGGAEFDAAKKPVPRPTVKKTPQPAAPGVESLMKRGHLFLEDSDWKQANDYFDRVLDIDPEYAPAYVGKLCAELKVRNEEKLGDYVHPIAEYGSFQKAVRFADDEYKAKIEEADEKIRERIRQKEYDDRLVQTKNKASTEYEYEGLGEQFRGMNGYKDTSALAEECVTRYRMLREQREEKDRQEQKRRAEQERKDREERERRGEQKRQEKEHRRQERYKRLCENTKTASTEEDWRELAEGFRAMDGYENTIELASRCEDRYRKRKERREEQERKDRYTRLCEEVKTATTEGDWQQLAERFRGMNGYRNTIQLAEQCEERNRMEQERIRQEQERREEEKRQERYNRLLQAMDEASAEKDYRELAERFRAMMPYKNTAELANECNDLYQASQRRRKITERLLAVGLVAMLVSILVFVVVAANKSIANAAKEKEIKRVEEEAKRVAEAEARKMFEQNIIDLIFSYFDGRFLGPGE